MRILSSCVKNGKKNYTRFVADSAERFFNGRQISVEQYNRLISEIKPSANASFEFFLEVQEKKETRKREGEREGRRS